MSGGWVYIMTNRPNGTLYVGVTSDLSRRIAQHRSGAVSSFTRKYGVYILVYAEFHDTMEDAMLRERHIKKWRRAWKLDLIERHNPQWRDLYEDFTNAPPPTFIR